MKLVLFDLDHTLLNGDSDTLWCDYLIERGILNKAEFSERNQEMAARYKAGTVNAVEFVNFYTSTLSGKTREWWQPYRQRFLDEWIVPRISKASHDLVRTHMKSGDLVIMTTATNRFITELTAAHLEIPHLIATKLEMNGDTFTGKATGVLNLRDGKPTRLRQWLSSRALTFDSLESIAYSDSINDLPLLEMATHAIAANPDDKLKAIAIAKGWQIIRLHC
jgi:HAD superfamily hydrolase (TIGR01490 family)